MGPRATIPKFHFIKKQEAQAPRFCTQFHDTIGRRFIDVLGCLYCWYQGCRLDHNHKKKKETIAPFLSVAEMTQLYLIFLKRYKRESRVVNNRIGGATLVLDTIALLQLFRVRIWLCCWIRGNRCVQNARGSVRYPVKRRFSEEKR